MSGDDVDKRQESVVVYLNFPMAGGHFGRCYCTDNPARWVRCVSGWRTNRHPLKENKATQMSNLGGGFALPARGSSLTLPLQKPAESQIFWWGKQSPWKLESQGEGSPIVSHSDASPVTHSGSFPAESDDGERKSDGAGNNFTIFNSGHFWGRPVRFTRMSLGFDAGRDGELSNPLGSNGRGT